MDDSFSLSQWVDGYVFNSDTYLKLFLFFLVIYLKCLYKFSLVKVTFQAQYSTVLLNVFKHISCSAEKLFRVRGVGVVKKTPRWKLLWALTKILHALQQYKLKLNILYLTCFSWSYINGSHHQNTLTSVHTGVPFSILKRHLIF